MLLLDLNKHPAFQDPVILRYGERRAETVTAMVTDHGYALDLSKFTVRLECRLRDGPVTAACATDGTYATFEVPPEMAQRTGWWDAYLSLEAEGIRTTTNDFQIRTIKGKEGCRCSR